jgi:hypothetical protein
MASHEENGIPAVLDFDIADLTPKEIPVTYQGIKYVLVEATTDAGARWRNELMRSTKLSAEGKPLFIDGMANADPFLVSLCLFEVTPQGKVSMEKKLSTIRKWPDRITMKLAKVVKQISNLSEGGDETEEGIQKQMKELASKLKKVREGRHNGGHNSPSKKQQTDTESTSA